MYQPITRGQLLKDLALPAVIMISTALAMITVHTLINDPPELECIEELEYNRHYISSTHTQLEIVKWCARHPDDWEQLIKLHNYNIRLNDIHE